MPRHRTPQQEFRAMLMQEFGIGRTKSYSLAKTLMFLATRYHKIQEGWCNVNDDEETQKRIEKREAGIEHRVKVVLQPYIDAGHIFDISFEGDPRGYEIKLKLKSGRYNNWGGERWGIPCTTDD